MKLTSTQLRRIIREEAAAALDMHPSTSQVVDAALEAFTYVTDGLTAGGGRTIDDVADWAEQSDAAAEDFRNRLAELVDEVLDRLESGGYAQ